MAQNWVDCHSCFGESGRADEDGIWEDCWICDGYGGWIEEK